MRIGEVLVISPPGNLNQAFIKAICGKLEHQNNEINFGRLPISDELSLHLYGMPLKQMDNPAAWDLISPKLLGYILLFDWNQAESLKQLEPTIDTFSSQFRAPLMVVGCAQNHSEIPMPSEFYSNTGITLEKETRFTFCHLSAGESCKNVVRTLIDILLEKL